MSEFWTRDVLEGSLKTAAGRFFAWYRDELIALFPPSVASWLVDRGDRELILCAGERALWLLDGRGAPAWSVSVDEIAASSLDEALARRGVARKTAKIGLEIDGAAFFVRRFDIPSVAAPNLAKLIVADIERKTPLRLTDVVYGHTVAKHPSSPEKLSVSLWILRRDIISRAIEDTGLTFDDIGFVRPSGLSATAGIAPVIVLEGESETSQLFRNVALGLCAATMLLAALGVGATLWRQAKINEELDARIF